MNTHQKLALTRRSGTWTPDLVKDASIDDVGVAVAFLSMNGAKLITGETLYIDGGYHIID